MLDDRCLGIDSIGLVARDAFWDEDALPFTLHGGGPIVRMEPKAGFRKPSLVVDRELLPFVLDAGEGGWLVPSSFVSDWMQRNVRNEALDDVLLAHPLYQHWVQPDAKGRSRIGLGSLVHWTPGVPTQASLRGPPLLEDRDAPEVNRDREAYAGAVEDLLAQLGKAMPLVEHSVELSFRGKATRRK